MSDAPPLTPATAQLPPLLAALAADSARPALCRQRLLQLLPALAPASSWPTHGRRALVLLLSGSDAASRYLLAEPRLARRLLRRRGAYLRSRKPAPLLRYELRQLRAASPTLATFLQVLRRYRVQEWVRLVGRSLLCPRDTAGVLAEQSELAEALLDALLRAARRQARRAGPFMPRGAQLRGSGADLALLGQGKLGAHELNLSSDVDVQFLWHHRGSLTQSAGLRLAERFTRLVQQVVTAVGELTEAGFLYRIDVDLRPEGKRGPLLHAVIAAEHYYESVGASWERLALMRGRHIAGASWVSSALLRACQPFIYPRTTDMHLVAELAQLKARLLASAAAAGRAGLDLKLGAGGIREAEFFVQALQLLFGGRIAALRTPSLLGALAALQQAGVLSAAQQAQLRAAYLILRRCENLLQALDERQEHHLPSEPQRLLLLGKLLGRRHPERLQAQLQRTCRSVARVCRPLLGQTRGDAPAHGRLPRRFALALQPGPEQSATLGRLGFAAPAEAAALLHALQRAAGSPFSAATPAAHRRLAPRLLALCVASADPLQALRLWVQLEAPLRRHPAYFDLLVATPLLARRLVDLLGSSEFLGRTLALYPELLELGVGLQAQADVVAHLRTWQLPTAATASREEVYAAQLEGLRRFKLQEQLRIGLLDLGEQLPIHKVLEALSELAEASLRGALQAACRRQDMASPGLFCVVGLGRLGGGEMGYGSDLDLVFVYEQIPMATAVRLAQRLLEALSLHLTQGPLYTVDTRLRPSGAQGPLVCSSARFLSYHRQEASLWEHQALLRARPVAGDLALGARLLAALAPQRYPPQPPAGLHAAIVDMRVRLVQSRPAAAGLDLKLSPGGLQDLDFLTQALQLRHAGALPALRQTSTLAALRALRAANILTPLQGRQLLAAYAFLRRVEGRLRMLRDTPTTLLPTGPAARRLARRCGYPGAHPERRLSQAFARTTAQVRRHCAALAEG